jgi:hypothetical protein
MRRVYSFERLGGVISDTLGWPRRCAPPLDHQTVQALAFLVAPKAAEGRLVLVIGADHGTYVLGVERARENCPTRVASPACSLARRQATNGSRAVPPIGVRRHRHQRYRRLSHIERDVEKQTVASWIDLDQCTFAFREPFRSAFPRES